MSVPKYELTYFDLRGLAEVPRLIFALAGVDYKDSRFPFKLKDAATFSPEYPEWLAVKKDYPYEKIPLLTVDGKHKIPQSGAIVRYLGREFKLAGKDSIEQAQVDATYEQCKQIQTEYQPARADATKKAEFFTTTLPHYFELFESVYSS
jgi:prostaglandin-H2 D-isomerase / glutathione transferase